MNGEYIFVALLAVTNENGEIRTLHLVTTPGHSQSILALSGLSESLTLYGQNQPEAMFTDNVYGDKQFLEGLFGGSLKEGVVPVEKYAHLDELHIPAEAIVSVEASATSINRVCRAILEELDESGELVVGFDTEWNVDVSASDRLRHRGPTALVQIAFKNQVHIFQVCLEDFATQFIFQAC